MVMTFRLSNDPSTFLGLELGTETIYWKVCGSVFQ